MGDLLSGCGCCSGSCTLKTLDLTSDWVIDSGTLTDSMSRLYFNGTFSPASPIYAEAFTIILYDFVGDMTFTIDGIDYRINATGSGSAAITANGTTKTLVRTTVGDTSKKLAVQIRITPTHAFIIAAESNTPPPIIVETNQIYLYGDLYAMVTCTLASPPSGDWSVAGSGNIDRIRLATSTPNCFIEPDLGSAYYGYLALLGGLANEVSYPGAMIPNGGFTEPMPHWNQHLFIVGPHSDVALYTDGFGTGFLPPTYTKLGYYYNIADRFGLAKCQGNCYRTYEAGGTNYQALLGISLACEIKDWWTDSTPGTPYPLPQYLATASVVGGFNQPYRTGGSPVYVYSSPSVGGIGDGTELEYIPINTLGDGSVTIPVATTTYTNDTTIYDPSLYPSLTITRYLANVSGSITL